MLLIIMYRNERYDMVKAERLDELIAARKIKKFYRDGEWIDIETAPLRTTSRSYVGEERRVGIAPSSS